LVFGTGLSTDDRQAFEQAVAEVEQMARTRFGGQHWLGALSHQVNLITATRTTYVSVVAEVLPSDDDTPGDVSGPDPPGRQNAEGRANVRGPESRPAATPRSHRGTPRAWTAQDWTDQDRAAQDRAARDRAAQDPPGHGWSGP